jgi:hypothetical protein
VAATGLPGPGCASERTCWATAATSSPNPRRYSVTFGQLRRARLEHRKRLRHPEGERDPWGRPLDDTVVLVLRTWTYDGTGHTFAPAAELALASAARAREHHDQADDAD